MTINSNPAGHAMSRSASGLLVNEDFLPTRLANCWAWFWSGADDEYITHNATRITAAVNLASPGVNDLFKNAEDNGMVYNSGPFAVTGTYTAPHSPIGNAEINTPQFLYQTGDMAATGEFYIAFAGLAERSTGERWFVGDAATPANGVRIGSSNKSMQIVIAGTQIDLTGAVTLTGGQFLTEIWRDASNNLHCWVNGVDETTGTPSSTATFGLSGIGGGSAAAGNALDDNLFEVIYFDGLPSESERAQIRADINSRWGVY